MSGMKTVGESPAYFKLSERGSDDTKWGHSGYITVQPQDDFSIGDRQHLTIFFTPRKGTTFKQVEQLADQMNEILEKVHFNIDPT